MANAWWACYGSDYLSKTGHLTMLQHGAYFTLLNTYYVTGEPLPVNNEQLVRMCRAHSAEEIEAISFILSAFFVMRSDGWHNKRADEELKEARRISKVRRLARLNKRKSIDITNDNQVPTQSQLQPHIEPIDLKTFKPLENEHTFVLPDWIPKSDWFSYEKMRTKINKPLTNHARNLAVNKLHKLRSAGYSPSEILQQSVFNSWQGLFELRGENGQDRRSNQAPRTNAAIDRYHNNKARAEQELGIVVGEADSDGPGHAPGLSAGSPALLEGRIK